jgi:hypothetical protein
MPETELLKVYRVHGRHFIYAPKGFGEVLEKHLEFLGIEAVVSGIEGLPLERLEPRGDVDGETLQAILDRWKN